MTAQLYASFFAIYKTPNMHNKRPVTCPPYPMVQPG